MRSINTVAAGRGFLGRILIVAGLLCAALPGLGEVRAAEQPGSQAPVLTHQGTIDGIDLETNSVIISGMRFEVPLDAPVTIRGGAGAFTLLQEGMKAQVVYYEYPDTRVAISLDQLPDNLEIQQF